MGHRPAGCGFKFGCVGAKRLKIIQMRAIPLICRRIEFEVDLVKPANEVDRQP